MGGIGDFCIKYVYRGAYTHKFTSPYVDRCRSTGIVSAEIYNSILPFLPFFHMDSNHLYLSIQFFYAARVPNEVFFFLFLFSLFCSSFFSLELLLCISNYFSSEFNLKSKLLHKERNDVRALVFFFCVCHNLQPLISS